MSGQARNRRPDLNNRRPERGDDGSPSATDFLLYDVPRVRDRLAADFERNTLATDDPDVHVHIGAGVLVAAVAIYAVCVDDIDRSDLALRPTALTGRIGRDGLGRARSADFAVSRQA